MNKANNPDVKYDRVTEILSVYTDFSFVSSEYLARKADIGTRTHRFCELYARDLLIEDVDLDCKGYVDSFKTWYKSSVKELLLCEHRMFDDHLMITGQVDLVVKLKGQDGYSLIDIKTSKKNYPTYPLQTAAYSVLLTKEGVYHVNNRYVLLLNEHGEDAKLIEHKDFQRDMELFYCAHKLHNYFHRK